MSKPRFEDFTPDWQNALLDSLPADNLASGQVEAFYGRFMDGLGLEVIRHCQGKQGKPVGPDEVPWERLLLAGMWSAQVMGDPQASGVLKFSRNYNAIAEKHFKNLAAGYTRILLDAVPYLWLNSTRMAALNSGDLPRFQVSKTQFPFPFMWWTFETDLKIDPGTIVDDNGKDVSDEYAGHSVLLMAPDESSALSVGPMVVQILTHSAPIGSFETDFYVLDPIPMPHYGEYLDDIKYPDYAAGIFKLLAFAQSPYLTTYRHRSDRGERRRFEKMAEEAKPDVHVVILRSARAKPGRDDGNREAPDWSCRWMVRGHYRNQWYEGERKHRLIWVAPYVKGPEDKPFKTTVYEVAR